MVGVGLAATTGPWRQLANVILEEPLPGERDEEIGFDPANTGGGFELTGLINRIRLPAYRGSRRGRGMPPAPNPPVASGPAAPTPP